MGILLTVSVFWNLLLIYDVWQKKTALAACEKCCRENCTLDKGKGGSDPDVIEYNPRNYHSKK